MTLTLYVSARSSLSGRVTLTLASPLAPGARPRPTSSVATTLPPSSLTSTVQESSVAPPPFVTPTVSGSASPGRASDSSKVTSSSVANRALLPRVLQSLASPVSGGVGPVASPYLTVERARSGSPPTMAASQNETDSPRPVSLTLSPQPSDVRLTPQTSQVPSPATAKLASASPARSPVSLYRLVGRTPSATVASPPSEVAKQRSPSCHQASAPAPPAVANCGFAAFASATQTGSPPPADAYTLESPVVAVAPSSSVAHATVGLPSSAPAESPVTHPSQRATTWRDHAPPDLAAKRTSWPPPMPSTSSARFVRQAMAGPPPASVTSGLASREASESVTNSPGPKAPVRASNAAYATSSRLATSASVAPSAMAPLALDHATCAPPLPSGARLGVKSAVPSSHTGRGSDQESDASS